MNLQSGEEAMNQANISGVTRACMAQMRFTINRFQLKCMRNWKE